MGSKRITEEDEKSFFGTLNRKLIMKKRNRKNDYKSYKISIRFS